MRQAELAERIGVSPSLISMIMNDKRGIGWGTAKKLAAVGRRKAQWWMEADLPEIIAELKAMASGEQAANQN